MQPTLCSRCKKNIAVVFIAKMEGDQTTNEGLCLKCARDLGLPQVDDMIKRMGISDEDLENINNEMMQAMSGVENLMDLPDGSDDDSEEEEGGSNTGTLTPSTPSNPGFGTPDDNEEEGGSTTPGTGTLTPSTPSTS